MPGMNRAQLMDAPVGLLPLPRPLMIAEVLDSAYRLFRAGILRCLPYSGLAVLVIEFPSLYATFFAPLTLGVRGAFAGSHVALVTYLVVFACIVPLLGAITLRLDALARGLKPRFRTEVFVALKRWPTAVFATAFAFGFPSALWWLRPALLNSMPTEALMFASVPVLWPTAFFVLAMPAFWSDRLNAFAACAQALRLSARQSWRLFGAILATLTMVMVFIVLSVVMVGMMSTLFGRADLFLISAVTSMLYLVIGAFGMPFVLAVLVVAYQDSKLRDGARRGARP
jgi:hypothetical protein